MRDRIPKDPNFLPSGAKMKQRMSGELFIPPPNAPILALQQVPPSTPTTNTDKKSSKRNRRKPMYYGFEDMSSDFVICAPPERQRKAGDIESLQLQMVSVVETVQSTAGQAADETNTSIVIGNVSSPASQVDI